MSGRSDRRGVSDTIGFVFIFAMIVATVGLVLAGGLPALESVRDAERVDNAERAFDVLSENVDDVRFDGAPSRATEIKLSDASLSLGAPVTVNVSATDTSSPGRSFSTEYTTRPVVFEVADSRVVYTMGGVMREESSGAAFVRSPSLVATEQRVVLSVLVTRASGGTSVAGSTTVLVRTDRATQRVVAATEDPYDAVYLNVTSPRAGAWARELDGRGDLSCSLDAATDTARCEVRNVDRTYVSVVEVDVAFE